MLITTETGSIYDLDLENKIWNRVKTTTESGHVRTTSGEFYEVGSIEVGEPVSFVCPPIREGSSFRYIKTSKVVKIEETK